MTILHVVANKLLAGLPRVDSDQLVSQLSLIDLPQNTVLLPAGEDVTHVYFPLSGMVSLVVVMEDGRAIETATVGREGGIGLMAGLGIVRSQIQAIVQLPTTAARISAKAFKAIANTSAPIVDLCIAYNNVLLAQARITAACNALHPIEARFCRWLLQTNDRAPGKAIPLTQEFLSMMLGVRRTSVTEVAHKMQAAGIISYSRGVIIVLDFGALKAMACECYDMLRAQAPG